MDKQNFHSSSDRSSRIFFQICGIVGIASNLIVVLTDFIGIIVVDSYNPIKQTISNLAIGDYAWIQDIGLNLYGIGLIVCAIALWRWNLGDWRWQLGATLLFFLGIDILIISEHDQYAKLPNSSGFSVHLYAVYVLGLIFPLICFLLSFGFRKISRRWQYFSLAIAVVWLIFAPPFFQISTAFNGLYERFVALILLCWTTAISWLIFHREN
ncbi:DUF998 domain-containing protein [Crocosphaera chwakensis]|uniref:DUF998 domain-containing protein n=1 Tax=Crocosphaera chwakensis CCY0110 TaxID=391612 RepID=A3IX19_9CHRO|nr:DUF998 domain-containing protein [Crocosphaera chwakensis]EAZ88961.1 hypothetical protein CY0110_10957 [Crocosphaera chwakensis CCY0110]